MSNPNAYFYRNVAPGEVYKTGPFTEAEKKIFLARVEELKDKKTGSINGEWGIFFKSTSRSCWISVLKLLQETSLNRRDSGSKVHQRRGWFISSPFSHKALQKETFSTKYSIFSRGT